jgi:hypothetical protein
MIEIYIKIEEKEEPTGVAVEFRGPPAGCFCSLQELAFYNKIRDSVIEIMGNPVKSQVTIKRIGQG